MQYLLWEPGGSLILHGAAAALRLHAAAACTDQEACCEAGESSKRSHGKDESSGNHACQ